MDEPLSNLDAKLRSQIRTELITLYKQLKTTFVYVTHDQMEAMSMSTKIALLNKGVIQQYACAQEIYNKPANVFTAKFIGAPPMNVLDSDEVWQTAMPPIPDVKFVGFRPENIYWNDEDMWEDKHICFKGKLINSELLGDQTLYHLEINRNAVFVKSYDNKLISEGEHHIFVLKKDLHFFDINENCIEITL